MNIREEANYCLNCKTRPCATNGCPLNNNIPEFINKIKEEKNKDAFEILEKTTVLSSICGRICPHKKQCEGKCTRGIKGNAVSIGELEAYIGDLALEKGWKFSKIENNINKKIAIIGGGAAGISAAAFLKKKGYDVTIFEKYNELGGILVHGIPEFRLDKKIIKDTIAQILDLGIKTEYNKEIGRNLELNDLKLKYDAILLSFGANTSVKMNIEGEDLNGVYGANELLEKKNYPDFKDKIVAVNGGGNTAMDMAREAKLLGAKKVYIIYRRAKEQMPAEREEIEDTLNAGVEFLYKNNIIKINGIDKVESIECIKTELKRKEGEERLIPVNIKGSNYKISVDYVLVAVGSKPEQKILNTLKLNLNNRGYIDKNEYYQTSDKKVFCAGDIAGEIATIAWAARSGRNAAEKIDQYLKNKIETV